MDLYRGWRWLGVIRVYYIMLPRLDSSVHFHTLEVA
jgi:hypothetical protein